METWPLSRAEEYNDLILSTFLCYLDIDECKISGFCSQKCVNGHGKVDISMEKYRSFPEARLHISMEKYHSFPEAHLRF